MKNFIENNKYLFALFLVVFAGIAFMFRDSISDFLVVREKPGYTGVLPDSTVGSGTSTRPDSGTDNGAKVSVPYSGRDPVEVRPNPDEVKGLSQGEREKMYSDIGMHGRAVKENPDFFFGWIQIGLLKKIIGDYEGARDAWEYAGAIRPLNSVSFANLGELYWRYSPDYPKSEKNFLTSIKNKPDDSSTYISLSDLYFYSYSAKKDRADDILLEGIKANPKNTDLMRWLASLYEREKEYSKALEWWKKVIVENLSDQLVKQAIADIEARLAK